jgi:hypothetical protein
MNPISSRTPEGMPNRCGVCGKPLALEPSPDTRDAPCPHCGQLLGFPHQARKPPVNPALARALSPPAPVGAEQMAALATLFARATVWLGPPRPEHLAAATALADPARLAALAERVRQVASWDELLATP